MRTGDRPKRSWLTRRLLRGALVVSVPLAVIGATRVVGGTAAQLKQWKDGDTLTAADINGNFAALSAQIAALTAPLAWNDIALVSAWAPYGSGYNPPSYAKDALGIVHLRGLVKGTPVPGMMVATMPVGFRPAFNVEEPMACGGNETCTVVFKPTGEVIFEMNHPAAYWLSFDGLTFEAAPATSAP
jgi:hypothetical protein